VRGSLLGENEWVGGFDAYVCCAGDGGGVDFDPGV
jgi:hypothetical protein